LWGKPAAAIGASVTDYGAMWAQEDLRRALGIAGARVLQTELAIANANERFDEQGRLTDVETRERLAELLESLVEHHHAHVVAA
jgi:chromate reductase